MPQPPQTSSARLNFIEQMGLLTQADGGPRIAGRLLGLMIVEGRRMALSEIAAQLEVAKASASTNARLLARSGIIRHVSEPGDRQDYYELSENPFESLLATLAERLEIAALKVEEASNAFAPDDDAGQRVRKFAQFYTSLGTCLTTSVERARDEVISAGLQDNAQSDQSVSVQ